MILSKRLQVTTGSRLHFGLFSVGQVDDQPQFGGCGLMVAEPANQITLHTANDDIPDELLPLIHRWHAQIENSHADVSPNLAQLPGVQLKQSAPRHCGFGSGTQLAMAIGLAFSSWYELALCDPNQLSTIMGRGHRSGIGTHGFFHGGFLVDRGKRADDELALLDLNFDFPESWPILILTLETACGAHGPEEVAAFKKIPRSTPEHRHRMIDMVKNQIAPAIAVANYDDFGDALFEYGRSSGSAYASVQGGDFHSSAVERLVYQVRNFGVPAVGQSSWGPCVFAIARNDDTADSLAEHLRIKYGEVLEIKKTFALNQGAKIQWLDLE